MVVTTNGLSLIRTEVLDTFNTYSYMGFGTDTVVLASSDTTLSSEADRVTIDTVTQGTTDITYVVRVPKSKLNTTLSKLGLFNAASSGTLASAKQFDANFTKTLNDEILVTYKIRVEVTNN